MTSSVWAQHTTDKLSTIRAHHFFFSQLECNKWGNTVEIITKSLKYCPKYLPGQKDNTPSSNRKKGATILHLLVTLEKTSMSTYVCIIQCTCRYEHCGYLIVLVLHFKVRTYLAHYKMSSACQLNWPCGKGGKTAEAKCWEDEVWKLGIYNNDPWSS